MKKIIFEKLSIKTQKETVGKGYYEFDKLRFTDIDAPTNTCVGRPDLDCWR